MEITSFYAINSLKLPTASIENDPIVTSSNDSYGRLKVGIRMLVSVRDQTLLRKVIQGD